MWRAGDCDSSSTLDQRAEWTYRWGSGQIVLDSEQEGYWGMERDVSKSGAGEHA